MSDDVNALLSAYRAEVSDKVPSAERDWERLEQKLDAGVEPLSLPDAEHGFRRRWVAWGLGSLAAILLAAWGLYTYGHAFTEDAESRERAAADVVEPEAPRTAGVRNEPVHNAAPSKPRSALPPEPEAPVEPQPEPEPPPAERAPAKRPAPKASPKPTTSPVIAEAKSLRSIRAALRDGNGKRALSLLRRHRRAFKGGALRDEADLLEADALCSVGRKSEARTVATRMVERSPNSPLAARARTLCQPS